MVTMTEQAQAAVKEFLEKEKKPGFGLRISVGEGGCSGFQYDLSLCGSAAADDEVYHFGEISLFVDKMSLLYLKGTTIDYVNDLRGSGFVFQNPNAQASCGCGHSFEA